MLKAYKYRILPNPAQQQKLAQHFGCARYVYNWAIACRKSHYEATKQTLSKRALQDKLVHEEKVAKPWLKAVNSQALLAALQHATGAFDNFFKQRAKFPRFKTRKNYWQSYQCPQHVKVDFDLQCVQIPMIGWVKAKLHRKFEGVIKTCTIKRTPHGAYFISILVDNKAEIPQPVGIEAETTLGLDMGLKDFAVASSGVRIPNPHFLSHSLPELRQLCRSLSRKKHGSNNRAKARLRVAKKHYQVARQREHFLHQAANQLLSENQTATVALEDLHIKGMIKNRRLSRHISDVAWSRFANMMAYKLQWSARNLIFCNRFAPSSKQCSCGYRYADLKLSERVWTCPECMTTHDRDLLAANNIKHFALAEAVGHTACVKPFPHDEPCQRRCHGERSDKKSDGSQEAPTRNVIATL